MSKTNLTPERLRELLHYNPNTGIFTWKVRRNQRATAGSEAGHREAKGYVSICIDGNDFKAHRLAWLYVHGCWPKNQIDHKNQAKHDNRIDNLRDATQSENLANTNLRTTNTSGFKGVHFDTRAGKWRAQICVDGKRVNLGSFESMEDAIKTKALRVS